MSDLLGIGASGVRAYQTALGVVGENIANVNTPGYVRRDVRLTESAVSSATNPLTLDRRIFGGVDANSIVRAADSFRDTQVRLSNADLAATQAGVQWLEQAETAFKSGDVSAKLTAFFNGAAALAADPSGSAARTSFLNAADAAAASFRQTGDGLATISADIANAGRMAADQLNGLSKSLATVNDGLRRAQPGTNAKAALLDERDRLLDQMSSLVGIAITEDPHGAVEVRLNQAHGPVLVSGGKATLIAVDTNASGVMTMTLDPGGTPTGVAIQGGALGGLAEAAARVKGSRDELDNLARAFAIALNANQAAGIDLDGNPGGPLLSTGFADITASPTTVGAATIAASVAPGAVPAAGGYRLTYDGGADSWNLARIDGSASVTGNGTVTLDGLTLTLGGAPRDFDNYTINVSDGARGLNLVTTSGNAIAAAAPWSTDAAISNAGSGTATVQVDAAAVGLAAPALPRYNLQMVAGNIEISDPLTSTVLETLPFVPGMTISGAGFSVKLGGQPAEGDRFSVIATGANSRDNGNLNSLALIRASGGFEGRMDHIVNANAANLESRKTLADAKLAIRDGAVAARDAVSGVNLDHEATELLRFQQAFSASSRVIQVARDIFQSILDIR